MPILKRFSSLRWKLVFSYVGVTLLTILSLLVILILVADRFDLQFTAALGSQSESSPSPSAFGGSLMTTILMLLPCMIPLGLIFGFVSTIGLTRRLGYLSEASIAIAEGDLSQRVQDPSGDEIGQLAQRFNAMADQLEDDTTRLRELAEHNARLAEQAQRGAAMEERHRLARDLHDGVKQHLFGVNLATSAALNLIEGDPETARTKLLEAKDLSRQAQDEMTALLNELRPVGLDERGLIVALTHYLDTFERREGISIRWQNNAAHDLSLPLSYEQALFRIAQEALANVARHAAASQVVIELHTTAENVILQISDDGKGFDPAAMQNGSTMGLRGMLERLTGLGGSLTVDTAPGKGTRLEAHLPRPAHTPGDETHA